MKSYEARVRDVVESIITDYGKGRDIDKAAVYNQPDQEAVQAIVSKMLRVIYPGYYRDRNYKVYNVDSNLTVLIEDVIYNLTKQISLVLHYRKGDVPNEDPAVLCKMQGGDDFSCASQKDLIIEGEAQQIALEFCSRIPKLREYLDTDLEATLDGDPAALNKDEIVLSYPGLLATTINRMAHELFLLDVPLIPRMMTEYAHSMTGIDIHPGATIGKYFFMDHGTGIVVGSSTIIGDHVKVYQGVTLGALSTSGGQKLRGTKRHPTIEDHVTIYSGASILGGETVIGRNSVIGSNAFITSSIPEGTRVTIKNQELVFRNGNGAKKPENKSIGEDENWFYII